MLLETLPGNTDDDQETRPHRLAIVPIHEVLGVAAAAHLVLEGLERHNLHVTRNASGYPPGGHGAHHPGRSAFKHTYADVHEDKTTWARNSPEICAIVVNLPPKSTGETGHGFRLRSCPSDTDLEHKP